MHCPAPVALLAPFALCVALTTPVPSQDPVQPASLKKTTPAVTPAAVVTAWDSFEKAQAAYQDATKQARELLQAAPRGDTAAREKYLAAITEPREAMNKSREAFEALFARIDPEVWDPDTQAGLMEAGLFGAGQKAVRTDPERAVVLFRTLLERLPDSRSAKTVRSYHMHNAFAAAADFEGGIAFLNETLEAASDDDKRGIRINIGDLYAACGHVDDARAQYTEAIAGLPDELERNDPRARTKRYGDMRLSLLGATAPEIAASTWIGGTPKALSEHQGEVVVLDFWATWCGPCRHVMPALSGLYEERKADGLRVLGVTRHYENGYLPANEEQMMTGGESVREMDEAAFLTHLKDFKRNTGIAYPFVVGTKADFDKYHVSGIPTVVVVDKQGAVALVAVGSGSEPMVRAAVDAALKR